MCSAARPAGARAWAADLRAAGRWRAFCSCPSTAACCSTTRTPRAPAPRLGGVLSGAGAPCRCASLRLSARQAVSWDKLWVSRGTRSRLQHPPAMLLRCCVPGEQPCLWPHQWVGALSQQQSPISAEVLSHARLHPLTAWDSPTQWCTATCALSRHGRVKIAPLLTSPVVFCAVQGRPASRRPATAAPETAAAGRAVAARVWQGKGVLARPLWMPSPGSGGMHCTGCIWHAVM